MTKWNLLVRTTSIQSTFYYSKQIVKAKGYSLTPSLGRKVPKKSKKKKQEITLIWLIFVNTTISIPIIRNEASPPGVLPEINYFAIDELPNSIISIFLWSISSFHCLYCFLQKQEFINYGKLKNIVEPITYVVRTFSKYYIIHVGSSNFEGFKTYPTTVLKNSSNMVN